MYGLLGLPTSGKHFMSIVTNGCVGGGNDNEEEEDNGMLFRMTAVHSDVSHLTASAAFVRLKKANVFNVWGITVQPATCLLK